MNIKSSRLTLPILSLHYLIDKNERYPVSEIDKYIEKGTIFEELVKKYAPKYDEIRLDGLKINQYDFKEDHQAIIASLQNLIGASTPESYGIDDLQNGLLYLAGLLNELVQRSAEDIELKQ